MIKINGNIIGNECYPNNERILKIPKFNTNIFEIEFKYTTDIDISILGMCKRYLDDSYESPLITLVMKYVPYSRMDRKIEGYMFSLKYFCKLINDLNFDTVVVLDPHSNVTTALLDRSEDVTEQVRSIIMMHMDNLCNEKNWNACEFESEAGYLRFFKKKKDEVL